MSKSGSSSSFWLQRCRSRISPYASRQCSTYVYRHPYCVDQTTLQICKYSVRSLTNSVCGGMAATINSQRTSIVKPQPLSYTVWKPKNWLCCMAALRKPQSYTAVATISTPSRNPKFSGPDSGNVRYMC